VPEVGIAKMATDVLLLIHVPPVAPSLRLAVAPWQIFSGPAIALGDGVTVITRVTVQPEPKEYVIVAVPGMPPVTVPPALPEAITEATTVELDDHEPPVGMSLSTTDEPEHTVAGPVIGPGEELTVTITVAVQPDVVV